MFDAQQIEQVRNDQQQLQDLYREHNLSPIAIHNLLQQMTWDASAYAKMVQSQLGHMKPDLVQRIHTACSYIVDAVTAPDPSESGTSGSSTTTGRRCLDVGCGYGALIPILTTTTSSSSSAFTKTIAAAQIYGIDISTEMIKCAQELYPDCHFVTGDFLQYRPTTTGNEYFDGILFCSSWHDMPNLYLVLEKALSLLRNDHGSTIVIVHAQGAGHVQMQHVKNPILVPQVLPTATELRAFIDEYNEKQRNNHDRTTTSAAQQFVVQLTVAPADANTPNDSVKGYLAVLQKVNSSIGS